MKKPIEKLPVYRWIDSDGNVLAVKNQNVINTPIDVIIEKINELVERVNYHTDNLK